MNYIQKLEKMTLALFMETMDMKIEIRELKAQNEALKQANETLQKMILTGGVLDDGSRDFDGASNAQASMESDER